LILPQAKRSLRPKAALRARRSSSGALSKRSALNGSGDKNMSLFYNTIKKVFITTFFIAAVMILFGIDAADAQQAKDTFIIMGTGNVKKEDVATARRDAIKNCLVTAVGLKAAGLMNIESMAQNFETLKILRHLIKYFTPISTNLSKDTKCLQRPDPKVFTG